MNAAHGGQVLLSQAVADRVAAACRAGVALLDLGSVRLRDLADPEHVYQVVHPNCGTSFPRFARSKRRRTICRSR